MAHKYYMPRINSLFGKNDGPFNALSTGMNAQTQQIKNDISNTLKELNKSEEMKALDNLFLSLLSK